VVLGARQMTGSQLAVGLDPFTPPPKGRWVPSAFRTVLLPLLGGEVVPLRGDHALRGGHRPQYVRRSLGGGLRQAKWWGKGVTLRVLDTCHPYVSHTEDTSSKRSALGEEVQGN